MLLGRRLMAAPLAGAEPKAAAPKGRKAAAEPDEAAEDAAVDARLLRAVEQDDRFFCDVMENIPAQYYFPTDEEENWRRSAPKKYHKNVLTASAQTSSKHALKRAKFSPSEQKSNEQLQQAAAAEEKRAKQAEATSVTSVAPVKAKTESATGLDGLKERLALKIQAMREQRKADEKTGKKRQRANSAGAQPPAKKPRKGGDKKAAAKESGGKKEEAAAAATEAVATAAISYGSLLLNDEDKKKQPEKKTRNGQGIRGIKNLLKKAERNQQRIEELKKTDEGKALVQKKGWDKAIKQAAGEVVLDDPKLLRNKLKKKEKQKAKSSKEWKQRTTQLEMKKKEKQKKRMAGTRVDRHKDGAAAAADDKKRGKGPRAGFEGKKGEEFLNGDKKKKKGKK